MYDHTCVDYSKKQSLTVPGISAGGRESFRPWCWEIPGHWSTACLRALCSTRRCRRSAPSMLHPYNTGVMIQLGNCDGVAYA